MEKKEIKDITGLDEMKSAEAYPNARKEEEYDLTKALLKAVSYRESDDAVTEVEIRKGGKYCFTLHVRPLSDKEARKARKKATILMNNPKGRHLPKIEKEFDSVKFNSEIIYMATTAEDKKKIWGNPEVAEAIDSLDPIDAVDALLDVGEKVELVDLIMDISGMNGLGDEEESTFEEYAKN